MATFLSRLGLARRPGAPRRGALVAVGLAWLVGFGANTLRADAAGPYAVVANQDSTFVSVIDTSIEPPTEVGRIDLGAQPAIVVLNPTGDRAYVIINGFLCDKLAVLDTTASPPTLVGVSATCAWPSWWVAVDPTERRAWWTSQVGINGGFHIYDVSNRNGAPRYLETFDFGPSSGVPPHVAFHPDAGRARAWLPGAGDYFGGPFIAIFNTSVDPPVLIQRVPSQGVWVSFSQDGGRAYVATWQTGQVQVYDTSDNPSLLGVVSIPVGLPKFIALHPTQPYAYVKSAYSASSISVLDVSQDQPTLLFSVPLDDFGPNPGMIALTPDGTRLYAADRIHDAVKVYDISDLTSAPVELFTIPVGTHPAGMAISAAF